MKIEITDIPDIVKENIDQTKQDLANKIIENVFPLFDEVYEGKKNELGELNNQLEKKRQKIKENKEELQTKMNEYDRIKKVNKLLDRVSKIVSSGLCVDGSTKHEIIVLLKIINKLSIDKIDYHLKETLKMINKRFTKI